MTHRELLDDPLVQRIRDGEGWHDRWEIDRLIEHCAGRPHEVVVEIGCAHGGSLARWMELDPRVIVTVDVSPDFALKRELCRIWQEYLGGVGGRLHEIHGPSQSDAVRSEVVRALGGRGIDILHIDGDHAFLPAIVDFVRYAPLVGRPGTIVLHDLDHYDGCDVPAVWAGIKEVHRTHEILADPSTGLGYGVIHLDEGDYWCPLGVPHLEGDHGGL